MESSLADSPDLQRLRSRGFVRRGPRAPTIVGLAVALLSLGAVWRTYRYALGMPIWGDEAFLALNFIWRDFEDMLRPLVYGQIAPLGFMWVQLAVTRVLGVSEWSLHLLPYLAGMAGLFLFRRFSREVLSGSAALLATGIFAGSYFIVRHSTEVKPYSTDLLTALGLTMLGWSVYRRPNARGRWIALIVLAGLAPWCSYPSMFVGGAVGLLLTVLLLREGRRGPILAGWMAFGIVLCGSSLLMYQAYAKPQAAYSADIFELESWSSTFPPVARPWALPGWFVHVHLGNLFAYPQGGAAPGSIATFALFVIGCLRQWRTNRALLLLLVGPFALNFAAAAMKAYPYGGSARVAQHLAPAICLLAGLGLATVLKRFLRGDGLRRGLAIASVVLAVIPVGSMVRSGLRPHKEAKVELIHKTIAEVARGTRPDDRWIVFNATEEVPYAPYLGDWRGVGGQFVFDVARFAPVPLDWAPDPAKVERRPGQRIWLLVYYSQRAKVSFPVEQLKAYLSVLGARLGEPEKETVYVEQKSDSFEKIEIYLFE